MLHPQYTYIAFDFETTGLDRVKDEPIQIGVVIFDHEFTILETFSSLIKPKKNIKELKSIVSHLTGFTLDQLQDAPDMESITETLATLFLGKEIVIVGHNIGFDLAFLQRYLTCTPVHQIDTYPLSKTLFHFLPSYALDVINEHLKTLNLHRVSEEDTYHDALYDSYLSYNLFKRSIEKLTMLRREYLILDYMFQYSSSTLSKIIKRTEKPYKFEEKELFFPALGSKQHQDNKKIISEKPLSFSSYKHHDTLDIHLSSMQELIQHTDWESGERILSFTHPSKVRIAEKLFKKQHIKTTGGHDAIVFDPKRVNTFLHKKNFDDAEISFSLKYYSQFKQKQHILDINSQEDYKIFAALSNPSAKKLGRVTLCTHQQLFSMKEKCNENHTLLFFDKDWRAQSYSKHVKQQFDPMYLIHHIEQVSYKYRLLQHTGADMLETFLSKTLFLHSTLSMEINPFFKGTNAPRREFINIAQETRFPKSTQLYPHRKELVSELKHHLMEEDISLIHKSERFMEYLEGQTTVSKRMYNGDRWYYQFQDTQRYVDRHEFTHDLPVVGKTLFLSSNKHMHQDTRISHKVDTDGVEAAHFLNITTNTDIESLIETIQKHKAHCFVASSDKSRSKLLYDACVKKGVHTTFEILGENITGGVGKNLYRGSISKKPLLLIGGYNFFMGAIEKGLPFSIAYLYHLHGKLARQIVQDMMWWREKN